jgi:hypothetical protein
MGLAIAGALTGSAQATVFEPTASLPLIGVAYISPTGAGCFNIGVCVTPGAFVLTSVVSSNFIPANGALPAVQDIEAMAMYGATLTPIAGDTPIGSVALTGTVDEMVFGRTPTSEAGIFPTLITGLQLTGNLILPPASPLDGAPVLVTLDGSQSEGTTTITPEGALFRIDSFFDVFFDISIPGTSYSRTGIGPIPLVAVALEPSTWAMMLIGFAGLAFAGWRRAAGSAA